MACNVSIIIFSKIKWIVKLELIRIIVINQLQFGGSRAVIDFSIGL